MKADKVRFDNLLNIKKSTTEAEHGKMSTKTTIKDKPLSQVSCLKSVLLNTGYQHLSILFFVFKFPIRDRDRKEFRDF